jgi:hypothetical protein
MTATTDQIRTSGAQWVAAELDGDATARRD